MTKGMHGDWTRDLRRDKRVRYLYAIEAVRKSTKIIALLNHALLNHALYRIAISMTLSRLADPLFQSADDSLAGIDINLIESLLIF